MTIADFGLAAIIFNLFLNESNPHYKDSLPFIKDREILKVYSDSLREELKDHLANRPPGREL